MTKVIPAGALLAQDAITQSDSASENQAARDVGNKSNEDRR